MRHMQEIHAYETRACEMQVYEMYATGTRPSKPRPLPLRKDRSNIALSVRAKAGRYGASYALGHYDTSFFGLTFFIGLLLQLPLV
jgi:hypothetical protein